MQKINNGIINIFTTAHHIGNYVFLHFSVPLILISAFVAYGNIDSFPSIKKCSNVKKISSLSAFKKIVILENGRTKPLDTYAKKLLTRISGRKNLFHKAPISLFAEMLFIPETLEKEKLVLINNPEIPEALGILPYKHRRYELNRLFSSFPELEKLSQSAVVIPPQERSLFESEILRTAYNVQLCKIYMTALEFKCNIDFLCIPDTSNPGKIPGNKHIDTFSSKEILLWSQLKQYYLQGNQADFDSTCSQIASIIKQNHSNLVTYKDPWLEIAYNDVNPLGLSELLYAIGLFLAFIGFFYRNKAICISCAISICAGLFLHTIGIIARTIIVSRPPVSNLYETFVFVSWTIVVIGCFVEAIRKNGQGWLLSAAAGVGLLHISMRFGLETDTMGMLGAVLNNNFWLFTHVTVIATGYAGCIAAGLLGHILIIKKLFFKTRTENFVPLDKTIYGILAFGFICTVAGTILGGLWAELAWGRFWGWDPKENGALLIILWCAIILHLRAGKSISMMGFAFGCIIGLVLVMFAWLGVNLLGIGMHSYGFTTSGAYILFLIASFEILFLLLTGIFYLVKSRPENSAPKDNK